MHEGLDAHDCYTAWPDHLANARVIAMLHPSRNRCSSNAHDRKRRPQQKTDMISTQGSGPHSQFPPHLRHVWCPKMYLTGHMMRMYTTVHLACLTEWQLYQDIRPCVYMCIPNGPFEHCLEKKTHRKSCWTCAWMAIVDIWTYHPTGPLSGECEPPPPLFLGQKWKKNIFKYGW